MFCPKCGQELIPQTRFCAYCGADIQSMLQQTEKAPSAPQEKTPVVHEAQNDPPVPDVSDQEKLEAQAPEMEQKLQEAIPIETGSLQSINGDDPLAAVVGKNQAYYLPEFHKIRVGEKSRFNWAAFLFGPAFCLYRKCEGLFKRYFLISISLVLIGCLVQTIGTVQGNLMLITGGMIITGVGGILGLVNSIRLGLRFDQLYYERCSGPISPDKFGTSVRSAFVFYAAIILSVSLIAGAGILANRHQYSTIFKSDTPGVFDISDIQGSLVDTSGSFSQPMGLPSDDTNEFDDVIGLWENENGNGDFLYIFYEDETAQRAYAEVATDEVHFVAELTRICGEIIHGVSPETQDSSYCEIELEWIGDGFEATIYYDEYFVDYITFVPSELNEYGYQGPSYLIDTGNYGFDALTGIWMDEEDNGYYLMIGYADETKQRAYAQVSTAAADFEVELTLTNEDSAEGNVMGYGSEPLYAISICRYKYWLEVSIYYGEYDFEDFIKFVPADLLTCPYENPYYVP